MISSHHQTRKGRAICSVISQHHFLFFKNSALKKSGQEKQISEWEPEELNGRTITGQKDESTIAAKISAGAD
jgi:hypothetical protein